MNLTIGPASSPGELQAVRQLCRQYADALGVDLETQDLSRELAELPGHYAPPLGCQLLAVVDGQPAGCVALKQLAEGICELKRLYVRPEHRSSGLGRSLIERLIQETRGLGYRIMRLDTIPQRMGHAVSLYRTLGFEPIASYWNNVLPGIEYLELRL
jgi:GNAT superfamily N-acetyltransferase